MKGGNTLTIQKIEEWKEEEEKLLVETVLRNISKGFTHSKAFEEVANHIGRTKEACDYRWYHYLRENYKEEIRKAKLQRLKNLQNLRMKKETIENEEIKNIISRINHNVDCLVRMLEQRDTLIHKQNQEIKEKDMEIEKLRESFKNTPNTTLQEDYIQFFEILNRARQLGVTEKTS